MTNNTSYQNDYNTLHPLKQHFGRKGYKFFQICASFVPRCLTVVLLFKFFSFQASCPPMINFSYYLICGKFPNSSRAQPALQKAPNSCRSFINSCKALFVLAIDSIWFSGYALILNLPITPSSSTMPYDNPSITKILNILFDSTN